MIKKIAIDFLFVLIGTFGVSFVYMELFINYKGFLPLLGGWLGHHLFQFLATVIVVGIRCIFSRKNIMPFFFNVLWAFIIIGWTLLFYIPLKMPFLYCLFIGLVLYFVIMAFRKKINK